MHCGTQNNEAQTIAAVAVAVAITILQISDQTGAD
jgi:hypothetical protein